MYDQIVPVYSRVHPVYPVIETTQDCEAVSATAMHAKSGATQVRDPAVHWIVRLKCRQISPEPSANTRINKVCLKRSVLVGTELYIYTTHISMTKSLNNSYFFYSIDRITINVLILL